MNNDEIRAAVLEALSSVAPEADLSSLDGKGDLRDALDLDSMDFLSVVSAVHDKLAVDIPEHAYREVRTLDAFVDYVARHIA
jgi:acyl carrier protein